MSAARIIQPPLSGRDRRHFSRQLKAAERTYEQATRDAEAAHAAADLALAKAHRLDCEAWSALQFIGGPEDPSPLIADAIHGGCELLEVQCRQCQHSQLIDLVDVTLVSWDRTKPVHSLRQVLFCAACMKNDQAKRRPSLVALRERTPNPSAPMAARGV
ncbi:hypothetical protein [Bradyrhizobium sp. SZCCHNRI1002]|uniref:hypothetical protein n=1 Tax=Bradyrhizobium sp. SZCCHNRI1002 TaxID=3057274 RepID=UPI0028ED0E8B|nr:hypothetical protein [Bradyrhizobium sp. SZCCHNRI1002]